MQKLELERKVDMRMVKSDELIMAENSMTTTIDKEIYNLAMKYEDLYFLVDNEGVKGVAIPTYRPQLIETYKRRKPIKKRAMKIIQIIENGLSQEYVLITL
jgi:RNA processing factor Prp31